LAGCSQGAGKRIAQRDVTIHRVRALRARFDPVEDVCGHRLPARLAEEPVAVVGVLLERAADPLVAIRGQADELGRDDMVRLLTTNLNEEKAADKKLSTVALRKGVNRKAAS